MSLGGIQATLDWQAGPRSEIGVTLTGHGALYFAGADTADREDFAAIRGVVFDEDAPYRAWFPEARKDWRR
ncbi:hypothetical protein [Streptomyces hokutonensis]|uniref:Uncharacterized protein n=1 Tax=Streptomyces hokutonensis TaxID=1306990 RepID=A0ABW6MAD1_9ACTN